MSDLIIKGAVTPTTFRDVCLSRGGKRPLPQIWVEWQEGNSTRSDAWRKKTEISVSAAIERARISIRAFEHLKELIADTTTSADRKEMAASFLEAFYIKESSNANNPLLAALNFSAKKGFSTEGFFALTPQDTVAMGKSVHPYKMVKVPGGLVTGSGRIKIPSFLIGSTIVPIELARILIGEERFNTNSIKHYGRLSPARLHPQDAFAVAKMLELSITTEEKYFLADKRNLIYKPFPSMWELIQADDWAYMNLPRVNRGFRPVKVTTTNNEGGKKALSIKGTALPLDPTTRNLDIGSCFTLRNGRRAVFIDASDPAISQAFQGKYGVFNQHLMYPFRLVDQNLEGSKWWDIA
ncbi:hypothetical protein A2230_06380 [candidate division WOR-1 bacterium RIFOXYA2_FULL_36_21]|uniref:Uncharacterized protein n=1 Tax=candidate division WOR-1 bacterium RIFOXYB2_FULL_36_35 TaxID=1802578 RepID=A0A1F4RZ08_UNCSA|nr:MAG: hypothetical protein A2230_06380 [candidate division WOR-1 bacterium RIFOXYA2_FULL_36_21]OGC13414.1 MAG: hypothetical protein A2290_08995 [candidate division WOR-1 bacterium RIFOXYB2_FULL_36_35]OGC14304.1 MAG: hypothetical protein A2282_00075 [candidate division WOR-1 bacterium RIFOXYA12_FULL_36_13]